MSSLPPLPEMERAYHNRDATYDGIFFLGVRTTGIFCRPSCPARKPLPQHVVFFATPDEAILAGYRACKRCDPLNIPGTPPPWVQKLLAEIEQDPSVRITDADLRTRGIDPTRARRYFLNHYGMTFQAFSRGRRLGQALSQIRQGVDLDEVTLGNGYDSHSGFREAFAKTFGLSPGKAQAADCIQVDLMETPLGPMVIGATATALCLVEFTNRQKLDIQLATLKRRFGCALVPGNNDILEQARVELSSYFAGELTQFSVPLIYPGSAFQSAVWDLVKQIPYGQKRSYESLALEVGRPLACRAVGTANGQNRIAILIPCHRVVNKSGQLGGYGGGLWRKQALLELEQGLRTFTAPTAAVQVL